MEQTEYKIKLDPPPDGMEIIGTGVSQKGDFAYMPTIEGFRWREVGEKGDWLILARRRKSLADWANGQRLFQALAEMRGQMGSTVISHHLGKSWNWGDSIMVIAEPPSNLTGKLRLEGGKWVDA